MNYHIKNWNGDEIAKIDLAEDIFGLEKRDDFLVKMINYQRAKAQAGTHACKGRSEVSGTTKKPFKQKGTGSARQGSKRAPHMPGGGIVFGPQVRSHAHKLNKKVRQIALKTALSLKLKEENLVILDKFIFDNNKTKNAIKALDSLDLKNALFVDGNEIDNNFKKSISNVIGVDILPVCGINVLSILKRKKLVLSQSALSSLVDRFGA